VPNTVCRKKAIAPYGVLRWPTCISPNQILSLSPCELPVTDVTFSRSVALHCQWDEGPVRTRFIPRPLFRSCACGQAVFFKEGHSFPDKKSVLDRNAPMDHMNESRMVSPEDSSAGPNPLLQERQPLLGVSISSYSGAATANLDYEKPPPPWRRFVRHMSAPVWSGKGELNFNDGHC